MAKSDKPNILVIWGDDIGISNLSCYTHGLMGYQTPNIDRVAKEGMMFTDSYGEQSCTPGARRSSPAERLPYRAVEGSAFLAPRGHEREDHHHSGGVEESGLFHRAVRQEPPRRSQQHAADRPWLRRVLRQPVSPQRAGGSGKPGLSVKEGFSEVLETFGPRGVIHSYATDKDDTTVEPRWGKVGKQKIEDTGPLNTKRMETCDDEFVAAASDFIKRQHKDGKPFFAWVNFTHMHLYTHTKPSSVGQAGRWQSPYQDTMIDHDKNVGQMLDLLDQVGHRRQHVRDVFDRQRPASQFMAGRRDDSVPQREEHQLGRRFPHPVACALAGPDKGRIDRQRHRATS